MFRRKKQQVAKVEELNDDKLTPVRNVAATATTTSTLPAASSDNRPDPLTRRSNATSELGLGADYKVRDDIPPKEELQNMNTNQLEQLIQRSADSGKASTSRALRMAHEAREIGVTTAETMKQQTSQLEKMSDEIEIVHDYLDKSEQTIEKMTKPKIVRMFQLKKPTGKGLEKQRASRKEQEEREQLRAKGLDSIDVREMQTRNGTVSMRDLQREELLSGVNNSNGADGGSSDGGESSGTSNRLRLFGGKKKEETQRRVETRDIQEDHSQYSESVAKVLRAQDEDLDQISDALADMKGLATAMNHELEYQSKMIDEVQDFSAETSRRTKANNRRIATIK